MNTRTRRSTKLYEGLTPKQKAALTLHFIGERNADEIGRIRGTVPWKEYRCIDAEYTEWRDAFTGMATVWGLMYWQELCQLQARAFEVVQHDAGDARAFAKADAKAGQSLARVMALEGALRDVCKQHGLVACDLMRLAGVDRCPEGGEPDADYRAEVAADLLACLPAC